MGSRRIFPRASGINVTLYDERERRSRSITVYGAALEELALHVQRSIENRWTSTKLGSRRHKRR